MKRFASILLLAGLTLGICRGYVALWQDGKNKPEAVYPYPAALLPPEDQQALEKGIPVENQEELAKLLEDFLS